MELTPMTDQDLARLRKPLEQAYAEDLAAHRGLTPEAGRERRTGAEGTRAG
ncbi:hypothetical protein [Micromonospora sp. NPDC005291]|uniref:hypothetical protein n=1 Tax=Micromonospora sp. NPDC005291 TaxID=3156872 RepID=UPI0033B7B060